MPNVSKATASETVTVEGLEVSLENFDGGYTVCFESHTADVTFVSTPAGHVSASST